MANDLILDDDNDLKIVDGDFVIGESELQEVELIIKSNKGEWKNDPLLGCDLVRFMKSKASKVSVEKIVRVQLERDGKDYDTIKKSLDYGL